MLFLLFGFEKNLAMDSVVARIDGTFCMQTAKKWRSRELEDCL